MCRKIAVFPSRTDDQPRARATPLSSRLACTAAWTLLATLGAWPGCTEPAQSWGAGGLQDAWVLFDARGTDTPRADTGATDTRPKDTRPKDAGLADAGPADTAALDVAGQDAPVGDGLALDAGGGDGAPGDGGADGEEADGGGSGAGLKCGEHLFSYDAPAGTFEVLVSGSFNGWGSKAPQAWPMSDDDGDGTWTVVKEIGPGQWEYKFIVDGKWIEDPKNPKKKKNEYNTFNSLLDMPDCPEGLQVLSHATDDKAGGFTATLSWLAGGLKAGDVAVTVDHAAAGGVTVGADGKTVKLEIAGLKKGIHDVRVTIGGETALLKVYIGVSTDWRDATLYFAMTDRFANGDKSNDSPIAGVDPRTNYAGGDFAGLKAKIDAGYFDDLGVGALWISWPVDNPDTAEDGAFPDQGGCNLGPKNAKFSPMKFTGNHGYWPSKLYQTDEHFGSMKALQDMVHAAHARGIRVLLDFTANHVHTSSPFFAKNKDKGFFHFPMELCHDVGWDNKPVTCWFTSYLADMNYGNPAAIEAMVDYGLFWAKETGADGFRLDAVKHVEMAFVEALRKRTAAEMERTGVPFYIVGETFTGVPGAITPFIGPKRIHGQFDFPANTAILKGLAKKWTGLDAMDKAVRWAKGVYGPGALMSNFIGNHDMARFISMASGDLPCGVWDIISNQAAGWKSPPKPPASAAPHELLRLAFAYIMTVPGVPLIYYGDEFGMPGGGDPDNRRMMRFGSDLNTHEKATLAWMQKLGKARVAHEALRRGAWGQPLIAEADFLAWPRTTAAEKAVIMLNRGDAPRSGAVDVAGLGVADGTTMQEVLGGGSATVSGGKLAFLVGARSAAIWVTK